MSVSNEEKIKKMLEALDEMALIGYRLDMLLEGFKYYYNNKNTLDIEQYEKALDVFTKAIYAMEEHMHRYHRLFTQLQNINKE